MEIIGFISETGRFHPFSTLSRPRNAITAALLTSSETSLTWRPACLEVPPSRDVEQLADRRVLRGSNLQPQSFFILFSSFFHHISSILHLQSVPKAVAPKHLGTPHTRARWRSIPHSVGWHLCPGASPLGANSWAREAARRWMRGSASSSLRNIIIASASASLSF